MHRREANTPLYLSPVSVAIENWMDRYSGKEGGTVLRACGLYDAVPDEAWQAGLF
jgi:hypothetical protein